MPVPRSYLQNLKSRDALLSLGRDLYKQGQHDDALEALNAVK